MVGERVETGVGHYYPILEYCYQFNNGKQRGLPIAFISSVGNQAQVSLAEMAAEFLKDPRVTALGASH